MSEEEGAVQAVVAKVTPERVARLVRRLEPLQDEANRGTVALGQLIDELLKEEGRDPSSRAPYEGPLREAILKALEQIPDMEFVEGG